MDQGEEDDLQGYQEQIHRLNQYEPLNRAIVIVSDVPEEKRECEHHLGRKQEACDYPCELIHCLRLEMVPQCHHE